MDREQQRFHASVAAMQGFFSVCSQTGMFPSFKEVSEEAVKYADALLAELDRTKPEPVTPQPDADGWIPHVPGDPMPCLDNAKVFIRTQGGYESDDWTYAFTIDWDDNEHDPSDNIAAWKPADNS